MLVGLTLEGGWHVDELIVPAPHATGGHFSTSYRVSQDGRTAFLKAIDFLAAIGSPDPARALQSLTEAFNFERDLLRQCGDKRLTNVVRALADGTVQVPGAGPYGQVSYLIFELADGDIRRARSIIDDFDAAWAFRSLHNTAKGLAQLHRVGIVHQDLKPSNVLTFDGQKVFKIADLGRASAVSGGSPHDDLAVAGDHTYAPPEAFYGFTLPDWSSRRKSTDLWHLGSLMMFHFADASATAALFGSLDSHFFPQTWGGTFEEVLPYLDEAIDRATLNLRSVGSADVDERLRARLLELCQPDPRRRGHPKAHAARSADPYSLERYISEFNSLAARCERALRSSYGHNDL